MSSVTAEGTAVERPMICAVTAQYVPYASSETTDNPGSSVRCTAATHPHGNGLNASNSNWAVMGIWSLRTFRLKGTGFGSPAVALRAMARQASDALRAPYMHYDAQARSAYLNTETQNTGIDVAPRDL